MVEMIRIKLASGLYDKATIWLDIKNRISWEDFDDIAEFRTHIECRKDLKDRIAQLPEAIKIYKSYQNELRLESVKAEAAELSGNKHYPFKQRKETLDKLLKEELKAFPTVNFDELPKFLA